MVDTLPVIYYDLTPAESKGDQCDCGLSPFLASRTYPLPKSPVLDTCYRLDPRLKTQVVELDNQLFVAVYIPSLSRIATLNAAAYQVLMAFLMGCSPADVLSNTNHPAEVLAAIQTLYFLGFLTGGPAQARPEIYGTDTLTVWLHVTNACSLHCTYCYVEKNGESLPFEVGQQALDGIFRSAVLHNYRAVRIKYAGGEPILALAVVLRLHRYAAELAARSDVALAGVVLSNGVGLTNAVVTRLKQAGLALSVSLDGTDDTHDRQRPLLTGKGSSVLVKAGIQAALDVGLRPHISITVTHTTCAGLGQVVEWIMARGLTFSVNLYRTQTDERGDWLEEQEVIRAMTRILRFAEAHPPRESVLGLFDRGDLRFSHQTPCSMGESYVVVTYQGHLAHCQMQLAETVGDVATCYDPVTAIRSGEIGLLNPPVDAKAECSTCDWRYWCAGGCALETKRLTGRSDSRSPHCAIYKALFPEIIRLEAIRLIRTEEESANLVEFAS